MDKGKRSISLSFLLVRFVLVTGCFVVVICVIWFITLNILINAGVIYPARRGETQAIESVHLYQDAERFSSEMVPELVDYALYHEDGSLIESSLTGTKLEKLNHYFKTGETEGGYYLSNTLSNGTTIVYTWSYVAQFTNAWLREKLPPFEYLWSGVLIAAVILCIGIMTYPLWRRLVSKLQMFGEVSRKVGDRELDFSMPSTGIKEFDQVMIAMDNMRAALKESLQTQWAAEQHRQMELAALAHDLKSPLTVIGGNAELLLEDSLTSEHREMAETIRSNTDRAQQYVSAMLEAASDIEEPFEHINLTECISQGIQSIKQLAEDKNVKLPVSNNEEIRDCMIQGQKEKLSRALTNILQNAAEHTPDGGEVTITQETHKGQCVIKIQDSGRGFTPEALHHATERFWCGDFSRGKGGHNGLGLWFANEVITANGGKLTLQNTDTGGLVCIRFNYDRKNENKKNRL